MASTQNLATFACQRKRIRGLRPDFTIEEGTSPFGAKYIQTIMNTTLKMRKMYTMQMHVENDRLF